MSNVESKMNSLTTIQAGAYRETVAGLTEAEYRRQQELARRPLVATDVPAAEWNERCGKLLLREDGVIVPHDGDVMLGSIQDDGSVFWSLSCYAYHGLFNPALGVNQQ
jgi:hypothetical protein